jgi:hypothetical protein
MLSESNGLTSHTVILLRSKYARPGYKLQKSFILLSV